MTWTEYLGEPGRAASANEVLAVDLAPTWHADVGRAASGAPAVGEHVVAIASVDRHVSLWNRETGDRIWRRRLDAPTTSGVVLAGDVAYATTSGREGRVHALRLTDGSRIWAATVGPTVGPLAVSGRAVVVTTRTGAVVALRPDDGSVVWRRRLRRPIRAGVTLLDRRRALVATDDSLLALSLEDGTTERAVAMRGAQLAPPALSDSSIVVTSPDGYVAAFARPTLERLWSVEVGEPIFGSPTIARDTVFAVSVTGTLWAIPLENPPAWATVELDEPVRAPPAPLARGVLVGTVAGEVLQATFDGSPTRNRARVDGPIEHQPIVRQGTLLVMDGRGRLHAWR